ncbi:unnamed protein product [Spirodela intermedia]|uniref:Non-specific lipid-transfer protein n=1 Tax=Spirodela intermedia TaxID=51605 RepID=A0A7I8JHN0_SPIIN|nr:unnamed protein product [Spirodela intermedia]CAA6669255.1 unnamed protein product [Spirodela intermedia]
MVACLLAVAPCANAAVDCETVKTQLTPCVGYVQGIDPVPAAGCCQGINNLIPLGRTTADRQQICVQAACNCLTQLFRGVNLGRARTLPASCGVSIPYPMSPTTNCSTIR